MSWPLSQDYNEAIQSPATNFSDADLKKGHVVANALGLPIPFSGNFADVYQVRCPDGSRWAVKCFTREAHGLRERYQEISAWLSKAKLPFSVDFSYLEQGIRVAGKWYPVLKMQWVEGLTLNQFVGQYLDKPAMLEALLQLWAKMGKYLRAAKVGHCDLQHGNVLLVPGSTPNALALKLIDYDGMWIPPLAKTQTGEVGHANYQHPRRLREGTYSLEVDRFPLLLVATAMRALKADKGLWAKYDNGDNLLFKESDLAAPNKSALFEELASLPDPGLVMLAAQVRAALKGPLESTVLLEEAMPETKAARADAIRKTVSAASVSPANDALAFNAAGDGATASFIRKRELAKAKQGGGMSGIPIAAWVGGAAALVVVVLALGGVALWAMSAKAPPSETRVVQKNVVAPEPKAPIKADPVDAAPDENPPDDPPVVAPPAVGKRPDDPGLPGQPFDVGWDKPVNPDHDCTFLAEMNALTIDLPGKDHDLAVDRGVLNAPRLLRNVEGDFTIQVRVSGDFNPIGPSTAAGHVPFVGAGLLLMVDDRTYLRLERAAAMFAGAGKAVSYMSWERWIDGKRTPINGNRPRIAEDKPTYLRLQRKGGLLLPSVSQDGEKWSDLPAIDFPLTSTVRVGLEAGTSSSAPLRPRFDGFQLTTDKTAVAAKSGSLSFESGWDKPVDAAGDCEFIRDNDELTIKLPGKYHDLMAFNNVSSAPRLLRDVEGDFTAQVQVSGEYRPSEKVNEPGRPPYLGAALLLMVDDRTYFRLDRAAGLQNGQPTAYINCETQIDGKEAPDSHRGIGLQDKPTWLRVTREADRLLGSVSQDGATWIALAPITVKFPAKMKIGVAAVTTSVAPFVPVFEDFRLTMANKTAVAEKPAEKEKLKPPTDDNLAKAVAAVKEEYKADYDKLSKPKERVDLANKLRVAAFTVKDNPDRQYALLVEARDLAARGEDLAASQRIINETAATFDFDPKEAKESALRAAGATFSGKAAAKAYLAVAAPLLQDARANDAYEQITPFWPALRKAATEAHDAEMTKTIASVEKLQKEYEAVKKDLQTLKEKPDDAEANLAVGKFYCFQKQDWDNGDPYLVKSGNTALGKTAAKDADAPTEAADQVALADEWMKLADSAAPGNRSSLLRRAYEWYSNAMPNLAGKEETRVKGRLAGLTKQLPDILSAWDNLDVSKVEVIGGSYLRLKPGQTLSTKRPVEGAVEIVLVARTAKAPPTFDFLQGNEVVVQWEVGDRSITGRRPADPGKGRASPVYWRNEKFTFSPNVWVTYSCKLTDAETDAYFGGTFLIFDKFNNDLSKSRKVELQARDQLMEIKSFTVNPLDKP